MTKTKAELRRAVEDAKAIMALEGFSETPESARLKEEIIAGRITFDEAVKSVIEAAKLRAKDNAGA